MSKQAIVPHLWYDTQAKEAAEFYVDIFGRDSKVTHVTTLHDTPSGDVDVVSFALWDYQFMAISAGPVFSFNPSISFMVNFDPARERDARRRIDEVGEKLLEGGKALMPLDKYPFSERYGWIQDKYGLSWQLIYTNPDGDERPLVMPSLLFVTETCEAAEKATDFYMSVFEKAKRGTLARYPAGMEPNKKGSIMFTDFQLLGQWFAAMDGSSEMHKFVFNEAVSLMVYCKDQKEIDYYWEKLSAVAEAEQCGWLKDKFGVSWQIVPKAMDEMMTKGTPEQMARVTESFLKMKKFDLAELEKAYEG
jgi:predicted 3-demethylubiquinone-9 3-methyltransferase (glyoxalase superfamily)